MAVAKSSVSLAGLVSSNRKKQLPLKSFATPKFKQMEKMMTGMMGMFKGGGMPGMAGLPGMGGAEGNPMGLQNGFRAPGKKKPKKGKKGNPWGKGYF